MGWLGVLVIMSTVIGSPTGRRAAFFDSFLNLGVILLDVYDLTLQYFDLVLALSLVIKEGLFDGIQFPE